MTSIGKRLDDLYHDPEFGWFTKRASSTTAVLGERHGLSTSTVWDHMQKCGITASTISTRWREGLLGHEARVAFYGHMLNQWRRTPELAAHVLELKQ